MVMDCLTKVSHILFLREDKCLCLNVRKMFSYSLFLLCPTVQNLKTQGTVVSKPSGKAIANKLSTVQQLLLSPQNQNGPQGPQGRYILLSPLLEDGTFSFVPILHGQESREFLS